LADWQEVLSLLENAAENKLATHLGISIWGKGENLLCRSLGSARPETIFDLASLTKPLACGLLALTLAAENKIDWHITLGQIWGETLPPDKQPITIRQLLTHSAGFLAHKKFYTVLHKAPSPSRRGLLKAMLLNDPLVYEPGAKSLYSDLGYMLLGLLLEDITAKPLDQAMADIYRKKTIKAPFYLPLTQKPPEEILQKTAPSGELETGGPALGQVQDGNAHSLGGVAGHAGLFGDLNMVAAPLMDLSSSLAGQGPWPRDLTRDLLALDTATPGSTRTMGFDTPSGEMSAAGQAPLGVVGHLGFTGASFWWQPEKASGIILLANRLETGTDIETMRSFRHELHTRAWQALDRMGKL
jgi:CubicO group peptidase (beta-lactamase class C family)